MLDLPPITAVWIFFLARITPPTHFYFWAYICTDNLWLHTEKTEVHEADAQSSNITEIAHHENDVLTPKRCDIAKTFVVNGTKGHVFL